jgi:hypothetical protein
MSVGQYRNPWGTPYGGHPAWSPTLSLSLAAPLGGVLWARVTTGFLYGPEGIEASHPNSRQLSQTTTDLKRHSDCPARSHMTTGLHSPVGLSEA